MNDIKIKFISHRGNLSGKNLDLENNPEYIINAIQKGFDVEIDLWVKSEKLYLGHDEPKYEINEKFINNSNFWIHAKNKEALEFLSIKKDKMPNNYFWHQNDDYTITSQGFNWIYPGKEIIFNSIVVLPEITNISIRMLKSFKVYGICSDNIEFYEKEIIKYYL